MSEERARAYADWIVANEAKKGTPEFDEVAKAYQAARGAITGPAKPDVDKTWGDYAKNIARQAGQGLTFNFGDEITAGARSVFGDETYDDALADERAKLKEFGTRNPGTTIAANIAGGLVGGGIAGVGLRGAAKAGSTVAAKLAGWGAGNPIKAAATTGAGSGAVGGFGEGEGGFVPRAASAVTGTAVGGALGAGVGTAIAAVPGIANVVKERVLKDPAAIARAADKEVNKALERSGQTYSQVRDTLERDRGLGVPSRMMNANEDMTRLGETAVLVGGKGANELKDAISGQRATGQQRVFGNLQKGISDIDFYGAEDDILARLKKAGREGYSGDWMNQDVTDPRILAFLQTGAGKDAFNRARAIVDKDRIAAELRGEDASHLALKDLFEFEPDGTTIKGIREGARPDLRTLDLMKRGLDDAIDSGFKGDASIGKAQATGLKGVKDAFMKILDGTSTDYKAARGRYRGEAEVRDALEAGRDEFMGTDAAGLKRLLDGMSDGEREAYGIGAMKSIRQKIFDAVDVKDPTKSAGINRAEMRERLTHLVGDDEKADLMLTALQREADIFRQGQKITGTGQSRTAGAGEQLKDFNRNSAAEVLGDTVDVATSGGLATLFNRGLRIISRHDFRNSELKADEVGKILTSGTPDEIEAVIKRLEASASTAAERGATASSRARDAGVLSGAVGAEAGGLEEPRRPMEITVQKPSPQRYASGGPVEAPRDFARELAAAVSAHFKEHSYSSKGLVKGGLDIIQRLKAGEAAPELGKRYPNRMNPTEEIDEKTGKEFWQKSLTPEAEAVSKARKNAQKAIDQGEYDPFFPVDQRTDVDPTNYPTSVNTLIDTLPKKADTIEKHRGIADTPGARERIQAAYDVGIKQPGAENWYYMKQLEDEFVKRLGPEVGRRTFQERFARPMAATTGGADPTSNLMMSNYGNTLATAGDRIPRNRVIGNRFLGSEDSPATYDFPFPVGGRYAGGNLEMFEKVMMDGKALGVDNPKRHNFEHNFLGHRNMATMDEQMSNLIVPKQNIPANYGAWEQVVHDAAAREGVDPRFMQEVAWAGSKKMKDGDKYTPKPMIQIVNEAVERTRRITGMKPEQIIQGIVDGTVPLYARGGLASVKRDKTRSRKSPSPRPW